MNQRKPCRAMIEAAFRTPDVPTLSNNQVARLLGVDAGSVRAVRRRLESSGEIPVTTYRLGLRGFYTDVTRVTAPPWAQSNRVMGWPDRD